MLIGRNIRLPDIIVKQINYMEHEARDTLVSSIFSLMKSRIKGGRSVSSPSL